MKSIQLNYFAADEDLTAVGIAIFEWHANLMVFPPRGSGCKLAGRPIVGVSQLIPKMDGEMHLLCETADAQRVHTTFVDTNISCIATRDNPVVEYSPSAPIEQDIVKIGRFYASYADIAFLNDVRRLFRLLTRKSKKLDDSGLRIFPHAAQNARKLRPWGGKDWDNPFFVGDAND